MDSPMMQELLLLVDETPLHQEVYDLVIKSGQDHEITPDSERVEPDWLAEMPIEQLYGLAQLLFDAGGYPEIWMHAVQLVGYELLQRISMQKQGLTAAALMTRLMSGLGLGRMYQDGPRRAIIHLKIEEDVRYSQAVRSVLDEFARNCYDS